MRRIAAGAISSGNGLIIESPLESFPTCPADHHVVLSSEKLYGKFKSGDFVDLTEQAADRWGCGPIAVLLFIRNPIGHLSSAYQQAVKRSLDPAELAIQRRLERCSARLRRSLPMRSARLSQTWKQQPTHPAKSSRRQ